MQGRDAVSPDFGRYEYDAILGALADKGLVVISELRGRDTPMTYASKVVAQVRKLTAAGVPAGHVTVAGFSKGGVLARATAAELQDPAVNFVIMAGCGAKAKSRDGRTLKTDPLALRRERHDGGQLPALFAAGIEAKEVKLTTGLRTASSSSPGRNGWSSSRAGPREVIRRSQRSALFPVTRRRRRTSA
jgi:dienelactone hydrolase